MYYAIGIVFVMLLPIIYIFIKGKVIVVDKTDPECQQILLDIKRFKMISGK